MTKPEIDHYRKLLAIHAANNDGLLMVKTDDLRLLLDSYEWYANPQHKPRVRVQAEPAS